MKILERIILFTVGQKEMLIEFSAGYYENLLRDFYGKIHTKKSEKSASLCRDLASFICLLKCSDTLDDQ